MDLAFDTMNSGMLVAVAVNNNADMVVQLVESVTNIVIAWRLMHLSEMRIDAKNYNDYIEKTKN